MSLRRTILATSVALLLAGCGTKGTGELVAPICGFPEDPRCPDAGVDAGDADAGDTDAGIDVGESDAGIDAGESDAGITDGG